LLALQLAELELPERLEKVVKSICRVDIPLVTEGWQRLERRCRQGLIAWAIHTGYKSNSPSAQALFDSLRPFIANGEQPAAAESVAEVARVAANASEYVSPWLTVDLARLVKYADICFASDNDDALSCRLQLGQLALWQRNFVTAQRILSSIPEQRLASNQASTYHEMLKLTSRNIQ
jgi:hypothetical protein